MAQAESKQRQSLLAKANYLKLMAAGLADSMKNGSFSSLYKGQGMEFAGVREYIRGDDVRAIDWNVTARMSRAYVKQFEETRELQIFVILDASQSMLVKNQKRTKYEAAAEAGAIAVLAAELNSCPAGAVLFDGEIYFSCKPRLNKAQTMQIITEMDRAAAPEGRRAPSAGELSEARRAPGVGGTSATRGTALPSAITGAGKLLRSHSLVLVFSDFRAAGWEEPLISLSQKNEVLAFRMTSAADFELPSIGGALFEDAESKNVMELPSSSHEFQKSFRNYNQNIQEKWEKLCLSHGITPVIFDSQKEPLEVLEKAFKIHGEKSGLGGRL